MVQATIRNFMRLESAGGIVLMTSGTGFQGSPYYAAYAATRAYCINLGESLWYEFKPYNVNVLAVAAGLTLSTAAEGMKHIDAEKLQTTKDVVEEAMDALGEQPLLHSGEYNRAYREKMLQLPLEDQIAAIADHAITNFLGGTTPEQAIDKLKKG